MPEWALRLIDVVLNRSVEELFGAVLLALGLSAAVAVLANWLIRPAKEATAALTGLIMVVSLASMFAGAIAVSPTDEDQSVSGPSGPGAMAVGPLDDWIVRLVDEDRNGEVSGDEIRRAGRAIRMSNDMRNRENWNHDRDRPDLSPGAPPPPFAMPPGGEDPREGRPPEAPEEPSMP